MIPLTSCKILPCFSGHLCSYQQNRHREHCALCSNSSCLFMTQICRIKHCKDTMTVGPNTTVLNVTWSDKKKSWVSLPSNQLRETIPNRISGKIKLTSPAYSHTTVLLVSSIKFGLLTWGWLLQGWIQSDIYERLEWQLQALASVWAGYIYIYIQCCCFF